QDVRAIVTGHLALWAQAIRAPNYPEALSHAQQCVETTRPVPDAGTKALAGWMLGVTEHHLGRHAQAQKTLQHALDTDTEASRLIQLREIGWDRRISGLGVLANLLWVRGFADQAASMGAMAVEEARSWRYAIPIGVAMTWEGFNRYLTD